jgi:hypothetical protein
VKHRPLAGGRDPAQEIQLVDPEVSRRHFLIRMEGDDHVITELKAANGVYVNGAKGQGTQTPGRRSNPCRRHCAGLFQAGRRRRCSAGTTQRRADHAGKRHSVAGPCESPAQEAGSLVHISPPFGVRRLVAALPFPPSASSCSVGCPQASRLGRVRCRARLHPCTSAAGVTCRASAPLAIC